MLPLPAEGCSGDLDRRFRPLRRSGFRPTTGIDEGLAVLLPRKILIATWIF